MVELNIKEDHENQIILITTSKRKARIKLFIPFGNRIQWRIVYEDNKYIKGLSEGSYTSRKLALAAVGRWEEKASQSVKAKQLELFGDKKPPVLKRKVKDGARV